jgi:dienelactone hydrolase
MPRRLALALVVVVAIFTGPAAGAQPRIVDLDVMATDGAKLRATYYSPGKPGPGMLLLHQCNMNRKSWTALGAALAERGIHALAIDYRGYGDSPRRSSGNELAADIDAAFASLTAQPGVDGTRLAAGGASCGVNNAIQLARRTNRIRALVLLSGPTTAGGLAYLREHPTIAIFAAASTTEQFAVSALSAMTETSTNSATTLQVIDRPGHGVPLFDVDTALLPAIVDWLTRVLH